MLAPKLYLEILLAVKSQNLGTIGNCIWKAAKLESDIVNFQSMV